MANEEAILARMRSAMVPPHAFPHSLKTLGQRRFASVIEKKVFDKGVGGLVSYLVIGGKKNCSASLVCSVAAKELTLMGRKTRCTSLIEVVKSVESDDTDATLKLGSGYLVVGDLGTNTTVCTPFQWEAFQVTLMAHLTRGGGVIIGTQNFDEVLLGPEFLDALTIFETMKVE